MAQISFINTAISSCVGIAVCNICVGIAVFCMGIRVESSFYSLMINKQFYFIPKQFVTFNKPSASFLFIYYKNH